MPDCIFAPLDDAAANRAAARRTINRSAMHRWLQLMAALHRFRRQHMALIKRGQVEASAEERFWYGSNNRVTLLLALANAQIMGEEVSVNKLATDLFLSRAAVAEIVSEAKDCLFLDSCFRLNEASQNVLTKRLGHLLDIAEVRNFADTAAVRNIMSRKPIRLEDL